MCARKFFRYTRIERGSKKRNYLQAKGNSRNACIESRSLSSAQLGSARIGCMYFIHRYKLLCALLCLSLCGSMPYIVFIYFFFFCNTIANHFSDPCAQALAIHSPSFLVAKRHQRSNEWNDLKYTYTAEEKTNRPTEKIEEWKQNNTNRFNQQARECFNKKKCIFFT